MSNSERQKILVDVPRGMCARNFLQQGIVSDLARDYDVSVLSTFADDPAFAEAFADVSHVQNDGRLVATGVVRRVLRRVIDRVYHSFRFRDIARRVHLRSFTMMLELQLRHEFSRYLVGECIYRTLLVDSVHDLAERLFSRVSVLPALPVVDDVRLVLFTHVYYEGIQGLIAYARARGIKTVGFVHSWDNLNTKGVLLHKLDRLLVWNDYMKDLVIRCYPEYSEDEILVTGSPTFDTYDDADAVLPFEEFRIEIGFDPGREKLVTFVLGSPTIYPLQDVALSRFAARIASGELGPIRLVVRFEPNFIVRPFYAEYRKAIETVTAQHSFIHVSYPTNADSSSENIGRWERTHDRAALFLPSALKYSDAVVNTASTTSVQAAIFDTPIVSMFFNHDELDRDFFQSHEMMAFYQDHYHELVWKTGGTELARSLDDLIKKTRAYLLDPSLDRHGRRQMVMAVCGGTNAGSREKIVQAVRGCMEDPRLVQSRYSRRPGTARVNSDRPVGFKQGNRI